MQPCLLLLLGGGGGVVLPQLVRRQLLQLAGGQARDWRTVAGGGQVHAATAEAAARRQRAAPVTAVPFQAGCGRRSAGVTSRGKHQARDAAGVQMKSVQGRSTEMRCTSGQEARGATPRQLRRRVLAQPAAVQHRAGGGCHVGAGAAPVLALLRLLVLLLLLRCRRIRVWVHLRETVDPHCHLALSAPTAENT